MSRATMGNLCGKPSVDDTPAGRSLGSSSTPAYGTTTTAATGAKRANTARSSAPQPAPRVGGPARTVGLGAERDATDGVEPPRAAAARAAEVSHQFGLDADHEAADHEM